MGMRMESSAEVSATDAPEMPPKIIEATILTSPRPPRMAGEKRGIDCDEVELTFINCYHGTVVISNVAVLFPDPVLS